MAANGEENSIHLREMDEEALDKPELVGNVAKMLEEIGGSPAEDELNAAPTHEEDEDDQVIEDEEGDEPDADDDDEEDQPTPDDNEGEGGDTEEIELPEIPDAYYRSAARYGYKPEDVADMVDKIGIDYVTTMLQNLHQKDNNMTNVFSDLGRKAKELGAGAGKPPDLTSGGAGHTVDDSTDELDALVDEYGNDHPLVQMYKKQGQALNDLKESFNDLNSNLALTQDQVSEQEQELEEQTRRSVNGFFSGKGMELFSRFYGELKDTAGNWDALSVGQKSNRDKVCEYADQILVGAKMHGDPMSLAEAMERAHMIVSEPIAETITRSKIMKQVEKRHKARVVRPSSGKSTHKKKVTGKPANKQELVDRTNERLSSLFKGLRV